MQGSQSTGALPQLTLSSSVNVQKPRSLILPRGCERTWSTPALAGAFSLRKYAVLTKHIPGDRAPRAFAGDPMPEEPMEQIDLIGGNGNWRQIKAIAQFKIKDEIAKEVKIQERIKEQRKKERAAELADRRRKHQAEEEQRWQDEREQKRLNQIERERVQRENEEKVRQDREAAEEERRRRMPKTCETCDGSCKCQDCMGEGYTCATFLVAKKSTDDVSLGSTSMDHGRVYQGCEKCGGYCHNMLGDLKKGSGECAVCNGHGKIWPDLGDAVTSPKAKTTTQATYSMERVGEVKVL